MKTPVGIVGLGLMGGSLARALARSPEPVEVWGWSLDESEAEAGLEDGAIDRACASVEELVQGCALVVYATPLRATGELMRQHHLVWNQDTVVTDVASLKASLVTLARDQGFASRYVGSHPLAGGTGTGYRAGRAELFSGRRVWLTDDTGDQDARDAVSTLWSRVGADPEWIGASEHDLRMVLASHLPQLLSNILATILDDQGLTRPDLGPGGQDMTRLAGSSPDIWIDLLDEMAPEVASALEHVEERIEELAEQLREGRWDDVRSLMESTRRWIAAAEDRP